MDIDRALRGQQPGHDAWGIHDACYLHSASVGTVMERPVDVTGPQCAVKPRPRGKLLWQLFTYRRIFKDASLTYWSRVEATGAPARLVFASEGLGISAQLDLPVGAGEGSVAAITLRSREIARRGTGWAVLSWLQVEDDNGAPLAHLPIPAGYSSEFADSGDQGALWWDVPEFERLAAAAGITFTIVPRPARVSLFPDSSERPVKGYTIPDMPDPMQAFFQSTGFFMVVLAPSLLIAWRNPDVPWIQAVFGLGAIVATGLFGGLVQLAARTGWLERPPRSAR